MLFRAERAARGRALAMALAVALLFSAPAERAGAAPAAAPAGEAFLIKLTRAVPVQSKFHYSADATIVQSMTANVSGQTRTLRPRSLSVKFVGTEHVLAVNGFGEPTKAVYTVEKCTMREGKKEVTVVQPGLQVTVAAGKWQSSYDINQGALTIQDTLLLRTVLALPPVDGFSDDQCYGTNDKQSVGGTWPIRIEPTAKAFAASGRPVKKESVSGTVKLNNLETNSAGKFLRVQGKIKVEHFLPPGTDVPPDMKVKDATVEYKFTRVLPADLMGQSLTDSSSFTVLLKMTMDDPTVRATVPVDGKFLTTVGVKRQPIK